jgi:hypothetical protein
VGRGGCSHEKAIPGAEGIEEPEGFRGRSATGQGAAAPGGVFDHGTPEEDGPGTWEALVSPRMDPGSRRPGDQPPTRRVERVPARPAASGTEPGIRTEAAADKGRPEWRPMGTGESEGRV